MQSEIVDKKTWLKEVTLRLEADNNKNGSQKMVEYVTVYLLLSEKMWVV